MAAGYLVIRGPIKSLVQQWDCRLPADRTRWSTWYVLPHSFPHICAGNYGLDVKHPQMSCLKRGYTSPAHFKGNLLLPFSSSSSSSFSTHCVCVCWCVCVQMSNGLAMRQPEPWDMSVRKIGSKKSRAEIQKEWGGQRREEQSADSESLFPSVRRCGQHIPSNPNLHTRHGM